ncbi:hypothetical protein AB0I28_31340 [Phytomonospora sp. NPDC050363]
MSLPSGSPSARSLWPLIIAVLAILIVGAAVTGVVWTLAGLG